MGNHKGEPSESGGEGELIALTGEKQTTSIKIDTGLWKATKISAIDRNITASELVEQAVSKLLRAEEGPVR